jgi:hypothetical protein
VDTNLIRKGEVMKTATKEKKENKENMFKVRMSDKDLKDLKKISKVLKISDSETVRKLIESKTKELSKQKSIFE